MALPTISAGDLLNKGTTGMPTNPELSIADLQEKFDELSLDVIVPKFQALVTALENASAGVDLGVTAPTGITASNKVKSILDEISVILLALKETAETDYDRLVSVFAGITNVVGIVDGLDVTIPTCRAIADYVQDMGGGDMLRTIYDTDNSGVVDNSEKLGGYSLGQLFLTANKTLYISPTGSDTTGNGTSGSPYATVSKALSVVPKNLNGFSATISMANGTYTENILPKCFHGGRLFFAFNASGSVTINGYFHAESVTEILFNGNNAILSINNSSFANGGIYANGETTITIINTPIIINGYSSSNGVYANGNSAIYSNVGVEVNNCSNGIRSIANSNICFSSISGAGNSVGLAVDYGGEISYGTKTISATTEKITTGGGIITNDLYHSVTAVTWSGQSTVPTTSLCYRLGNLVRLDFVMPTTTGITNTAVIGQLPPRFRPSASTGYKMGGFAFDKEYPSGTDRSFGILCDIDTSGLIRLSSYLGASMYGASVAIEFIVP